MTDRRIEAISRVAVIAYHSSPLAEPGAGDSGGMSVYVRELASALAARGVETDIFTRAHDVTDAPVAIGPGVRVVPIAAGPLDAVKDALPSFVDEFARGVVSFASSERRTYDVVHSHYWQSGIVGRRLSVRWRVPLVHSSHTLGKVKNRYLAPGDTPEPLHRLVGESEVISAADVMVASTEEERDELIGLYGTPIQRIKTIYPGVDHDLFGPEGPSARAELGVGDAAVLLYVGRIQPLKGIELAIRATSLIGSESGREAHLVVVGGASGARGEAEVARLQALTSELGLDRRVTFLGPRRRTELPQLYRAADAVVVCSHSESFGFAALEAHACGVPVVGTAVGGLSHVVRDGASGFLVDTRDPIEFAARLNTLLGDDDLQKSFAVQAKASAARFDWGHTADAVLDLYECLARVDEPEACTC
ncbi:MAG TPA: glycosyltransferase [Actinomycetota bacterium]|nr:glycosyltransferase [Actinomycetota bacterium]